MDNTELNSRAINSGQPVSVDWAGQVSAPSGGKPRCVARQVHPPSLAHPRSLARLVTQLAASTEQCRDCPKTLLT